MYVLVLEGEIFKNNINHNLKGLMSLYNRFVTLFSCKHIKFDSDLN